MTPAYEKSVFKTSHNSYRWLLTEQLDQQVYGLELDIHDNWSLGEFRKGLLRKKKGNFKVGHFFPDHEIKCGEGNPDSNNLAEWLQVIRDWSQGQVSTNGGHPPLTVFIDVKDNLVDWSNRPSRFLGLDRLEEQVREGLGDRLYTPADLADYRAENKTEGWPDVENETLRSKVIVVLMGFHTMSLKILGEYGDFLGHGPLKTRLKYVQKFSTNGACFVAYNPVDADFHKKQDNRILKEQAEFVTSRDPRKLKDYYALGRVTRTDYYPKNGEWPPLAPYINFPATDDWMKEEYPVALSQGKEKEKKPKEKKPLTPPAKRANNDQD
jgi:hypothetical protein